MHHNIACITRGPKLSEEALVGTRGYISRYPALLLLITYIFRFRFPSNTRQDQIFIASPKSSPWVHLDIYSNKLPSMQDEGLHRNTDSEGLQVVETYTESKPRYGQIPVQSQTSPEVASADAPRRICGLRVVTFWLVVVILVLVVGAALGGGIGGGLASKNGDSESEYVSYDTPGISAANYLALLLVHQHQPRNQPPNQQPP